MTEIAGIDAACALEARARLQSKIGPMGGIGQVAMLVECKYRKRKKSTPRQRYHTAHVNRLRTVVTIKKCKLCG